MIYREQQSTLEQLAKHYPVVAITGPRQSGKTTLARMAFPNAAYVNLELPDTRTFARDDPRRFLELHAPPVIIDEIQRVPELLSYIQPVVDAVKQPGRFILTGSSNLMLLESVSQTLAGRVALLTLLPFALGELGTAGEQPDGVDGLLHHGLYPPIHDRGLQPIQWYADYVATYVERDVRRIIHITDLDRFQTFVRLCAGRAGQLLNLSALGNDCGISHNTARAWLSVLEASYIIYLLQPHHQNFSKRLVKSPKLYFLDPGLLAYLLDIDTPRALAIHSSRGALFESWVLSELLKACYNRKLPPRLSFWRDYRGREVDFLVRSSVGAIPIEAKSGATVARDYFDGLRLWSAMAGPPQDQGWVVFGGEGLQRRSEGTVLGWKDISVLLRQLNSGGQAPSSNEE